MKKIITLSLLVSSMLIQANAVTFTGNALTAPINASYASSAYVVVDTAGDGFDFSASSLGVTFDVNTFIAETDDFVVGYNATTSSEIFGTNTGGGAAFTLGDNDVTASDAFYMVIFGDTTTATVTTTVGLGFGIATAGDWVVPGSNSASLAFPDDYTPVAGLNATGSTVVPEPSTYAMLSGLCVLGFAALRRRRS